MENFLNIVNSILSNKWVQSLIVVVIAVILYRIVASITTKGEKRGKMKKVKGKTYLRLIRNITKYILLVFVIIALLQIHGVNVTSMVAGLGIIGIIIGFIVQDAFKDIIRGIDILSDDYFSVGDIVKYKDIEGKVIMVGLKTTKIEDIKTNNIISIANRNIEQIEVVSDLLTITIPMPYELHVDKAEKIIDQIRDEIEKDERVTGYTYKGINTLNESSIDYLIGVNCEPKNKLQLKRDILRVIMITLNKNKVNIPYKQIDIHTK